ncbi:MAG: hypothetical protein K6F35_11045 [Lachnospiraceae bacterium]|nr:hypothetical protein [Lachnospiraceae bacterium]
MIKKWKLAKFIQLAFTALAGTVFFLALIVVPEFRTRIFTDRPLLFLCAVMWALMVVTVIFILVDLDCMIRWEKEH